MLRKTSFITLNKGYGGAEKMFRHIVDSYAEAFPQEVAGVFEVDLNKSSVFRVFKLLWGARKTVIFWNCSVLGIHWLYLLAIKVFGAKLVLYPHLAVDHRLLGSKMASLRNLQMKISLRLSDAVIGISEGNDAQINRLHPRANIIPVRNFVASENTNEFHGGLDYRKIAVIGRIQEKHKGQIALISALAPILGKDGYSIDFFGSGPDEDELLKVIRDRSLDASCTLHGWKSELEIYAHDFGIVINYSRWEGLSLSLLESIFQNRIVFGNDIPGNRELLEPERLFSDSSELIRSLERLKNTPESSLVQEVNKKKRLATQVYSKEKSIQRLHECLRSSGIAA